MNITYNKIIEFLCDQEDNKFLFPTKKNLINNYDTFPENFIKILGNKYFRYGIQIYDNDQNNISLWSSILYLLDKKFILLDKKDQISYVKLIKKQCVNFIKTDHKKFHIKSKFSKQSCIDTLSSDNFNPLLIELLCFIFQFNCIIFDFEKNNNYIVSSSNILNCMKPFLIIGKYKNFWEPIHTTNEKIFNYNETIKNIFFTEIEYFETKYLDKELIIIDNIKELLDEEKINLNIIENTEDSETNTSFFTNKKKLVNNYSKSKLNKMKKDKLITLASDLGINVNTINKPNKNKIISLILDN